MRIVTMFLALFASFALVGCGDDDVVDIEGPGLDVEVEDDGETKVNLGEE